MLLLKKISLILTVILMTIASAMVWGKITRTLLVLDMSNENHLPKNFRSTATIPKKFAQVKLDGMAQLNIAGGGQFSELGLQRILQQLHTQHLLVIDLRQESHGFLDGNAISWYGPHDAANAGKTPEQIRENQASHLAKLDRMRNVKVHKIVKKTSDEQIEETKVTELPVRVVTSEADIAKKLNVDYQRIFVQDFHAPMPAQVDRFIQVVRQMPKDEWVYFHCRAGVGRTTTFMAMYDMMRNAKTLAFKDILARQTVIGGKDFTDMPDRGRWKYKFAIERFAFLKLFYEYARNNDDDFKTTWSAWLQKRG